MKSIMAVFIAVVCSTAFAKQDECEGNLTVDERYETLQNRKDLSQKEETIALTNLLNETFTPILMRVVEIINETDVATLKSMNRHKEIKFESVEWAEPPFGYDGRFQFASYVAKAQGPDIFLAPFNDFNREVMERLDRAIYIVERLVRDKLYLADDDDSTLRAFKNSIQLSGNHTYGGDSLEITFKYAFISVLQAAAQLTSDPVGKLTAKELLPMVMSQCGRFPSLIVQMSLMMRPGLLGPVGHRTYIKNPLELKDNRLVFTEHFRGIQKHHKDEFLAVNFHERYELGHGCPVAHSRPGMEKPALQHFFDALMHVYGALE